MGRSQVSLVSSFVSPPRDTRCSSAWQSRSTLGFEALDDATGKIDGLPRRRLPSSLGAVALLAALLDVRMMAGAFNEHIALQGTCGLFPIGLNRCRGGFPSVGI